VRAERAERLRVATSLAATTLVVVAVAVAAGAATARIVAPTIHGRYFLWVSGRALGLAAYLTLTVLVLLGTWIRHPWRLRHPLLHGESRLRVHAVLSVATVALVSGHVASLAADRYAGVGWLGAFVPGQSHYRTMPVAIGVVAMFALGVVGASAGLAGRRGTRHWLAVHRWAALIFVVAWSHGVLAGTDTVRLRLLYAVTGLVWVITVVTRVGATRVAAPERVAPLAPPLEAALASDRRAGARP
jgi:methionine sulfoxide reductase heme-binding subunit